MEDLDATAKNRNGGKVHNDPYSKERMEAIKRIVAKYGNQGRKKRFSISVDSELIVPVTTDIDLFDDYLDFIDSHTRNIEVRLYFGDSPNANRYIFYLQESALDGFKTKQNEDVNVDKKIEEALQKQSLETQVVLLEKKVKRLKRKVRSYEEQLGTKSTDVKELLSQGLQLYGEFKGKTPPTTTTPVHGLPIAEVELEAELSESDQFYQELKDNYGEERLEKALHIWEIFTKHPELKQEFQSIVNQKSQQNGKA